MFGTHNDFLLGFWRPSGSDTRGFWSETLGVEAGFSRHEHGVMVYLEYTFDRMPEYSGQPRFSYDRLLRLGARFLN
jgi:hypothetical protein